MSGIKPFSDQVKFYRVSRHSSGRNALRDERGFVYSLEEILELKALVDEMVEVWSADELDEVSQQVISQEVEYEERLNEQQKSRQATVKPGYVYLLRFHTGEYKIGKTVNLSLRLGNYSSHSTTPPEVICTIATENPSFLERQLHNQFASKKIQGREWFILDDNDVQRIVGYSRSVQA